MRTWTVNSVSAAAPASERPLERGCVSASYVSRPCSKHIHVALSAAAAVSATTEAISRSALSAEATAAIRCSAACWASARCFCRQSTAGAGDASPAACGSGGGRGGVATSRQVGDDAARVPAAVDEVPSRASVVAVAGANSMAACTRPGASNDRSARAAGAPLPRARDTRLRRR